MGCIICGKKQTPDTGVIISRCCCDSDWVCDECVSTKSLADYIHAAVAL